MSRLTRDSRDLNARLQVELARLRRRTSAIVSGGGTPTVPLVQHTVYVTDDFNAPKAGLVHDDFAIDLKRGPALSLAAAPEFVTITERSGGEYAVSYPPQALGILYRLRLTVAGFLVSPPEFQDIPLSYL